MIETILGICFLGAIFLVAFTGKKSSDSSDGDKDKDADR